MLEGREEKRPSFLSGGHRQVLGMVAPEINVGTKELSLVSLGRQNKAKKSPQGQRKPGRCRGLWPAGTSYSHPGISVISSGCATLPPAFSPQQISLSTYCVPGVLDTM